MACCVGALVQHTQNNNLLAVYTIENIVSVCVIKPIYWRQIWVGTAYAWVVANGFKSALQFITVMLSLRLTPRHECVEVDVSAVIVGFVSSDKRIINL